MWGGVWVMRMSVERGMRVCQGGVVGSYWNLGGGLVGGVRWMWGRGEGEEGDVRVLLTAAFGDVGGAEDVQAAPAFEAQVRGPVVEVYDAPPIQARL